ncbi:MAG: DHH family phosphoesterase [Candidatus Adiutrix sp.]|jgi:nanoRNase/pAp phosphatase (c-di-AMP/oligoRNAs hydrolase)|nr:DHH family phosphoesterase [Candidatus Adiutrix sp.]
MTQARPALREPVQPGVPAKTLDPGPAGTPPRPERLLAPTLPPGVSGKARLKAFMARFQSDDRVLIVISADPDAIAAAVAVKRLLWRRVGQIVVASTNSVKRPDNLQLLAALGLKLENLEGLDTTLFTRLVMVDSQPGHSPLTERLHFDVVIDHHPLSALADGAAPPAYVDIRPEIGATATIMAGYLQAAKIKPGQKLATALFYAVKTDTQNFVRQGRLEDMEAFRWAYPHISHQTLSEIEMAPIARSSFKTVVAGLDCAVFHRGLAFAFLERADHADTLVIVADLLMKIKGVSRSVAAARCEPGKLVVIFRAGGRRQDVGALAARAFGEYGSAGGHKNMARAEVPMENLDAKLRNNPLALQRFIRQRLSGTGEPN